MQTQNSFLDELKSLYRRSMFMKLIFINVLIFFVLNLVSVFAHLSHVDEQVTYVVQRIFGLPTGFWSFLKQPWGIITSIFTQMEFLHLLFNMLGLYFIGRLFEQIFGAKRLLYTYILGGVFGGLLEVVAHWVFPALLGQDVLIVGASGSIMALFIMLAFNQPNLKVNILIIPPFRVIWLALIYIALDLLRLGSNDGIAHFAHIGGAIIGFLGATNPQSSSNIIMAFQSFIERILNLFKRNPQPKLKVKRGRDVRRMTDEEYNADAKLRQDQIDRILDKISKSGYESLSKKEKDFLFNQSKNG